MSSGGSVLWAETPDDDEDETPEAEAHVDDSFAARRLRRWLKGMFGGKPTAAEPEPEEQEPRPKSDV
ncbi:MAG: hypothetical protein ACJ74L_05990 [Gaiellaceae bacterium]